MAARRARRDALSDSDATNDSSDEDDDSPESEKHERLSRVVRSAINRATRTFMAEWYQPADYAHMDIVIMMTNVAVCYSTALGHSLFPITGSMGDTSWRLSHLPDGTKYYPQELSMGLSMLSIEELPLREVHGMADLYYVPMSAPTVTAANQQALKTRFNLYATAVELDPASGIPDADLLTSRIKRCWNLVDRISGRHVMSVTALRNPKDAEGQRQRTYVDNSDIVRYTNLVTAELRAYIAQSAPRSGYTRDRYVRVVRDILEKDLTTTAAMLELLSAQIFDVPAALVSSLRPEPIKSEVNQFKRLFGYALAWASADTTCKVLQSVRNIQAVYHLITYRLYTDAIKRISLAPGGASGDFGTAPPPTQPGGRPAASPPRSTGPPQPPGPAAPAKQAAPPPPPPPQKQSVWAQVVANVSNGDATPTLASVHNPQRATFPPQWPDRLNNPSRGTSYWSMEQMQAAQNPPAQTGAAVAARNQDRSLTWPRRALEDH